MRVIAGTARSIKLIAPKGMKTRPTSDKIKETLFNILAPDLYGTRFLDLFAGSGGIGIEALSRGAAECTFVEKDREAVRCIRTNLEKARLAERASVINADVLSALPGLLPGGYDIIFMDPPYDNGLEKEVLTMLANTDIGSDTLIIAEASEATGLEYMNDLGFEVIRVKHYRTSKHVFIRKIREGEGEQP